MNNPESDLILRAEHHKIFIEQAPTAIAMLDKDMRYIAVSKRWISDYKMEGQNIIGRSHYDIFPEIGDDWKENHQKCLNGAIDVCDEAPFKRMDGSIQWIYWDVRPWYLSEGNIGGLLMHTGDITHIKEKEEERIRIEEILAKTNEVSRIGTWEIDLIKNEIYWSKIIREIHEVSDNYVPNLDTIITFFKEGDSRDKAQKALNDAIEKGIPIDMELELITAKGNAVWVRGLGTAEFVNGKCHRLSGIFQDINKVKLSAQALNKAHAELKALFNSKAVAIISTDHEGVIKHFNPGAELLLGYSASEIVGTKKSTLFLDEQELLAFRKDIAKLLDNGPTGNNANSTLAQQDINDTREWNFLRKNGSKILVESTLSSIKNEAGINTGYLTISTDIFDRKKAENELLKKNQLLNFAEEITLMGHWQWDTVADRVQWSNNLYNIFELDKKTVDLKLDSYYSFVHPDDKETVGENVDKSTKDKIFHSYSHRIITTTGKIKIVQLLGEVITNEIGEIVEMIGTCQDVTEQRMAEKKFRGLLESAPDAMVIVNEEGKIQLINKQSEKLFGYTAAELFEKPVEILIPGKFKTAHTAHRSGFFSNPKSRSMGAGQDLYGKKKNGEEIPIQISLSPLQTEEGLLVSAAIRDITAQKLAERKIIEAKENLETLTIKLTDKNRQLADFAHITSHNLRAPVSNLNSLLDIYSNAQSEAEKSMLFEKFETVIQHLTLTLNTLVEALKTKNEGSNEDLEEISFDQTLSKTKEILTGEILKTGAVIKNDFTKISRISYNKIYLESIFLNLMSNAIKYKSEDRVPEITIESDLKDGNISLSFTDNGLGIDLKRHGHKLFGLNKVFHRHPDAKGVGLFMTKTQVETMGGEISAVSSVNEGTTFTINFKQHL